jgi:hypothetical protein
MSAQDVVTASLRGLELGEVVCAPGVEDAGLLDEAFRLAWLPSVRRAPNSSSATGPAEEVHPAPAGSR